MTSEQVAERAEIAEHSVREWLRNQAAGGYVAYDADANTYELPPEQAMRSPTRRAPLPPRRLRADHIPLRRRSKNVAAFKSCDCMG
jgi:DNA-binding IclR family transcriptional regulator